MNEAKILELAEKAFGEDVLYDMRAQSGGAFIAFARLVAAEERERAISIIDGFMARMDCDGKTEDALIVAIRARS